MIARWYNTLSMNLLRTLLILIFSLMLLVTLWPLFVILMMGLVVYWIYFRFKFKEMVQRARHETTSTTSHDVIDVEVIEREEHHD